MPLPFHFVPVRAFATVSDAGIECSDVKMSVKEFATNLREMLAG